MAHYIHHVPGRLRVKTPALKRNEPRAQQVKICLERMHGVLEADVSTVTGSIVIKYDVCLVGSAAILDALSAQGHIQNMPANPTTHGAHPAQKVADSFITKLVETALERSAVALIAALI